MARRTTAARITAVKWLLCMLLCALSLSQLKQAIRALDTNRTKPEMDVRRPATKPTVVEPFSETFFISTKKDNSRCSKTTRLGLPLSVAGACPPEQNLPCSNLTCANLLFFGNSNLYETARDFMRDHPATRISDHEFVAMTKNCGKFRSDRGYNEHRGEEDFPLAFNLIVHEDAEQIERLVHALYRPQNAFCVHLDLKAPQETLKAVEAIMRCLPNVFMASKRVEVFWAEYGRLEADITCMKDHVSRRHDWKYLINTAGQAYPIRSMAEMVEILKIYNGANDIEGMTGVRIIKQRFAYEYERRNGTIYSKKRPLVKHPNPPHDMDIVKGSAYGIFSRKFVEYLISDRVAKDFLQWSNGTFSPDELYWASLHHTHTNPHLHPPGGYSGNPDAKPWLAVYVNWFEMPCYGFNRHGVCVFGVEDLPTLVNRKEFFVNKFVSNFEPLSLECLRTWVQFKDDCVGLQLLDRKFYEALPFIRPRKG